MKYAIKDDAENEDSIEANSPRDAAERFAAAWADDDEECIEMELIDEAGNVFDATVDIEVEKTYHAMVTKKPGRVSTTEQP